MRSLGILLFLFQVSYLDSCLVVHSTKCACPYQQLGRSNLELVSDHSFYSNVSEYQIKTPLISGDNCSLSMYCEGDYNLIILDTDSTTNLGLYAAEVMCDLDTRSWLVDDDAGLKTIKRLFGVCVNFDQLAKCTPDQTGHAFYLGYSNDLDRSVIGNLHQKLIGPWKAHLSSYFSSFTALRFDTKERENYGNFTSYDKMAEYVSNNLPDPSLRTADKETSGYAYDALQRIDEQCGSVYFVLMKRRPNSIHPENILALQFRKSYAIIIQSDDSYESAESDEMTREFGLMTYGFHAYEKDDRFSTTLDQLHPLFTPYQVYAKNVKVMGAGRKELPVLVIPHTENSFKVLFNFQNHNEKTTDGYVVLKWSNSTYTHSVDSRDKSLGRNGINYYSETNISLEKGSYNLEMEYNTSGNYSQLLAVRFFSSLSVDYWLNSREGPV